MYCIICPVYNSITLNVIKNIECDYENFEWRVVIIVVV